MLMTILSITILFENKNQQIMIRRNSFFFHPLLPLLFIFSLLFISCDQKPQDTTEIRVTGTMDAELTPPPYVPAPVGNREAKRVKVELEIIEDVGNTVDGTEYVYWTFGGPVRGRFFRFGVGD